MTRNILHRNRSVLFLDGGPLMPFEAPSSLLTRERNRNRGRKLEIAYHWVQIASPFVLVMLAISLFSVASTVVHADEPWDRDWTVVTMARDGSWGVGINGHFSAATAAASRNCRAMSTDATDCGAELATTRGGWVLGYRCGQYRILVAADDLRTAEAAALYREIDLKQLYVPDLPACHRVLTVDPRGAVTTASPRFSGRP